MERGRRDRLEKNALAGKGTLGDVRDLAAINRALAEPERSLDVFDGLPKRPPCHKHDGHSDGRDVLFDEVKSLLIEQRRYADYLEFLGNVDEGFARLTRGYELVNSASDGSERDEQSIAYARDAAVRASPSFSKLWSGARPQQGTSTTSSTWCSSSTTRPERGLSSRSTLAGPAGRAWRGS